MWAAFELERGGEAEYSTQPVYWSACQQSEILFPFARIWLWAHLLSPFLSISPLPPAPQYLILAAFSLVAYCWFGAQFLFLLKSPS